MDWQQAPIVPSNANMAFGTKEGYNVLISLTQREMSNSSATRRLSHEKRPLATNLSSHNAIGHPGPYLEALPVHRNPAMTCRLINILVLPLTNVPEILNWVEYGDNAGVWTFRET
ncbi:hypothetical protein RRG08_011727 [Elysia crispata]|uniref:Uncharacterized protein n=1 Tax=Elysia crispata TaxID=231223 RepID=A0AAE1AFQ3_9GAST|nr:hypothetical protein RRG08_011727 [Elysia crispata]